MQTISDSIAKIHNLKDGRKVTDINYGNLTAKKQKETKISGFQYSKNNFQNNNFKITLNR